MITKMSLKIIWEQFFFNYNDICVIIYIFSHIRARSFLLRNTLSSPNNNAKPLSFVAFLVT